MKTYIYTEINGPFTHGHKYMLNIGDMTVEEQKSLCDRPELTARMFKDFTGNCLPDYNCTAKTHLKPWDRKYIGLTVVRENKIIY